MIVGGGMMAKGFSAFERDPGVLIFASGVSNSLEVAASAFGREKDLLSAALAQHPDAPLVYFGTCSVDDPDRRGTPYVRHKLEMESLVAAARRPWIVLRMQLVIGPRHRAPTLANFLYDRIVRAEPFEVWENSIRYPIDIVDAARIARAILAERSLWRRTINVALRGFPVADFVGILEDIAGRRALYRRVPKGARYELSCPEVDGLARRLQLDRSERYLESVLRKYFRRAEVA